MASLPGTVADWHGFAKHDFDLGGLPAIVVRPRADAAPDRRPWLWRARFFGAFPSADLALLEKGWHVAHINIDELYGSPEANRRFDLLYDFMISRGFSSRPLLAGFSRGGLDVLSWASRHPERVGGLYLDNAVCDFASWPGGRGVGPGNTDAWKNCLAAWKLSEDEALARTPDLVYDLNPLARANIPLLLLVAEADEVVPAAENSDRLAARYRALGGVVREIRKPGALHHPHGLDNPAPIVDFAEKSTLPPETP